MIKITAKFPKFEELKARTEKRWTSVKKEMQQAIPAYLETIQAEAQKIVAREAYDTGALLNSINVRMGSNNLSGSVGTNIYYAEFVEFGHFMFPWGNKKAKMRWIPGVYYMTRAMARAKSKRQEMTEVLISAFEYYGEGGKHLTHPEMQNYLGTTGRLMLTKRLRPAQRVQRAQRSRQYKTIRRRKARIRRLVR